MGGVGATPILRARGLRKTFGSKSEAKTAVDGVDLDITSGDIYVLMGLSGSGKSTLLRMLNRLIEPTAGVVELDGENLAELNAAELRTVRNRRIAMVFQHFALFPHRNVRANAAYGLRVRGTRKAEALERAQASLELVGLGQWGEARPDQLSGGMQQRVGLARALSTDAEILLMDEPFSALDPLIRRDMQDLLLELAQRLGRTVVFVTHDLNEAMRLGDVITLLDHGQVAQTGTAVEILNHPADDYVRRFIGEVDRARVLTAGDVMEPTASWGTEGPEVSVQADQCLSEVAAHIQSRRGVTVIDGGARVGYVSSESVLAAIAEGSAA